LFLLSEVNISRSEDKSPRLLSPFRSTTSFVRTFDFGAFFGAGTLAWGQFYESVWAVIYKKSINVK
jgi:hypothetical protein